MGNIVKHQFEEQLRSLLLQFPNDVGRVATEASEYFGCVVTPEQVFRIRKKMKAHQDRDVSLWVASSITQQLFLGVRQRLAKLEAMFAAWTGAEQGMVSICCSAPVKKMEPMQGEPYYRCLSCNNTCNVKTAMYPEIERLKMQIIREMRRESDLVIKAAKDLGFTAKQEPGTKEVHQTTNFVMVNGQRAQSPETIPIDAQTAKRLEDMSPTERERVIKSIERMSAGQEPVVDTEFVAEPRKETSVEEA